MFYNLVIPSLLCSLFCSIGVADDEQVLDLTENDIVRTPLPSQLDTTEVVMII
jgi:hypothetical protein